MTRHCAVASNHPRIPTCTYRLQFNRWFTFAQAREIVAYLYALGVSDVYSSPYFQVSPESPHGYDITDHNKLNPSIGSRADYDAWIAELRAHGMGQVLDFVPNHVGIADDRNAWWMDILENGPSSTIYRNGPRPILNGSQNALAKKKLSSGVWSAVAWKRRRSGWQSKKH